MRNKPSFLGWILVAAVIAFSSIFAVPSWAAIIAPESATASSSFAIPASALIDGGGLDGIGPVEDQRHFNDENQMWLAGTGSQAQDEFLDFTLDQNYDLSSAILWQYNVGFDAFGNNNSLRGIDEFEVLTSPDLASPFSSVGTFNLAIATDPLDPSGEPSQTFALVGATNVRRVRIDINSALGGATQEFVGLSEIRFDGVALPPPPGRTWDVDSLGSWNDNANWDPNFAPNANTETATFGGVITAATTVVVDQPVTVKSITFDSSSRYVIAGAETVNLDADAGNANLIVNSGAHQFQAVVVLQDDTDANVAAGASIEFVNRLNLNGNTLTKTGAGSLTVSNTLNTGGGSIVCSAGTCDGAGTIGGNLMNSGGNIAPGGEIGTMTVEGTFEQTPGSTLSIEIGGTLQGVEYDLLQVVGAAMLNGTLNVELVNGFNPSPGSMFEVLTSASLIDNGLVLGGPDAGLFNLVVGANNLVLTVGGGGPACDFSGDGSCDITDIDQLYAELGSANATFDLNGDGTVDNDDVSEWLVQASSADPMGRTFLRGDADLDGDVDGPNFTTLAVNFGGPGTWGDGNFVVTAVPGGGIVGGPDFTQLAVNFGFVSATVVPEPSNTVILVFGWATGIMCWVRRRRVDLTE